MGTGRSWAWAAHRVAVSAFVSVHLLATAVWIAPPCPIRAVCTEVARYYIMPLGLWQYWDMFSPDPQAHSFTLEAEATDADGITYRHAFPKTGDDPWWRAMPKFRHPKFAANLNFIHLEEQRKVAARHALRQLAVPAASYPVDLRLIYMFRETPPAGGPPHDPLTPLVPRVVTSYHFSGIEEVTR